MKKIKTLLCSSAICSLLLSGMAYGAPSKPDKELGLGVTRPTDEQIEWMNKNMSKNKPINNNELAVKRINDELKAKGLPQLDANVAVPVGQELTTAPMYAPKAIVVPSSVDNSTLACFPPIGNQNPLGSCVAFSSTYYQFTHMTGLLKNWDVKNDTANTKKFSPSWTYNMLNGGTSGGLWISDAYNLLLKNGAMTWAEFPYDNANYKKWNLTNSAWVNAIKYRADQTGSLQVMDSTLSNTPITSATDSDLTLTKNYLNNGYVLSFATHVFSWNFKNIGNDPSTTADDSYAGKRICYARAGENGGHQMTIVGYNDSIWVDINSNNVVDAGEKGAFKVANSWGAYSSSDMDNGYYYVAYDALNKVSSVAGAPTFTGRDFVFSYYDNANVLYWITAKESSNPSLLGRFTVSHSKRSQMKVELGYSETSATTPVQTWTPSALNYCGGSYAFDGTGDGTGNTIVDGTFSLDFSDLVRQYNLANGTTKRWYLKVTDSSADGKPLTVKNFSLTNSNNVVLASTGTISRTADGTTLTNPYIYLDYALSSPASAWVNKLGTVYRSDAAATSYNNEIYIAGGYNENSAAQNSLLVYNPVNNSWISKATLAAPKVNAGAATLINKIYVAGGFNPGTTTILNTLEVYEPGASTPSWISKMSMNTARHSLGLAAANGKIYAIGGLNSTGALRTVEEYDPATDRWTSKTQMPTARYSFGIVSYNGKIYVIGGRTASNIRCNTVEVYDPLTDTWDTTKAGMNSNRDELGCTTYNGKIYAIGGFESGVGESNKTEEYNPISNTWTTKSNLNFARNNLSVSCVNDKLYAIGGMAIGSIISNKIEEYTP